MSFLRVVKNLCMKKLIFRKNYLYLAEPRSNKHLIAGKELSLLAAASKEKESHQKLFYFTDVYQILQSLTIVE